MNYKAILLGGLHNLEGITAPAFIESKLKHMMQDCNLVAEKNEINFTWNSKFPLNSLYIMRGYLCINPDIRSLYMDIMFDAYWKDNLDISNEQVLIGLLKKCKINKNSFFQGIKNQKVKDELKSKTKEARNKGVFGAPTFTINEKLFWGQDRLKYALDEYKK